MEGDSRGTNKSLQEVQPKAKPKPVAKKPGFVRLEPSCWHGRLVAWNTVIRLSNLLKKVFFLRIKSAWLPLVTKLRKLPVCVMLTNSTVSSLVHLFS